MLNLIFDFLTLDQQMLNRIHIRYIDIYTLFVSEVISYSVR